MQYDTIQEFNVDSKAKCDQINQAHMIGKKYLKKTKTNKRQCPLSSVEVKDLWRPSLILIVHCRLNLH